MGIAGLIRSFAKSVKIRKFGRKIANPDILAAADRGDFGPMSEEVPAIGEKALQEFFDLCERDDDVKRVMASERLNRSDLEAMYENLIMAGAGQWIKGHFVPLWALAFEDSLLYIARASRQGIEWFQIASDLVMYRRGEIPHGTLLQRLNSRSEAKAKSLPRPWS